MVNTLKLCRDVFVEKLDEIGVKIPTPDAGSYAFVPVNQDNDIDLCEKLITDENVAAIPGSAFGVEGYVRLSFASEIENIERGLEKVGPYLKSS
jgi:aspartate aminotransferase